MITCLFLKHYRKCSTVEPVSAIYCLVAALIGFVVMYFVSNRFLGPITVLTNIAKRMSELDFTAKYEVKTEDEVGVLRK